MLSPDENFKSRANDVFVDLYTTELEQLEKIRKTSNYADLLSHLKNYHDYIAECADITSPVESIRNMTNGTCILNMSTPSPEAIERIQTAHLAACVVLLEDFTCPLDYLNNQSILATREGFASSPQSAEPATRINLLQRLHGMDAVRTIQLLRIFGLITNRSKDMYQLGLGVATGNKDIHYVHAEPALQIELSATAQVARFMSTTHKVANIIISDLDERYERKYKSYENDKQLSISCYISDTYDLLETLKKNKIQKRNIITMLRIEPAMIPDSIGFLQRLVPVIDTDCDFVLSIGSGDHPDAYQQRIDVITDLFTKLKEAKLNPVLFKLHDDGDVLHQLRSLKFGSSSTSSYQILYCKLNYAKLVNAYV